MSVELAPSTMNCVIEIHFPSFTAEHIDAFPECSSQDGYLLETDRTIPEVWRSCGEGNPELPQWIGDGCFFVPDEGYDDTPQEALRRLKGAIVTLLRKHKMELEAREARDERFSANVFHVVKALEHTLDFDDGIPAELVLNLTKLMNVPAS